MTLQSIESLCGLPEKDAPVYGSWQPPAPKDFPASATVHAAISAQARKTAFREVKASARAYIQKEAYVSGDPDARPKGAYLLAPLAEIDKRAAVVAFRYLRARAAYEQRHQCAGERTHDRTP